MAGNLSIIAESQVRKWLLSGASVTRPLSWTLVGVRCPATGVDQHELASIPGGVIGNPVPSYSWHVLDHSLATAEHPVDQS